ncbi:MAG TPA: hypothetical protein VJR48_03130 [Ktedonobacterales bacterium]|nr:hypothetical protein [Ktedonobacterales bacterium]
MDRERGQEIEEYKRKLARSDKALENAKQEVEKAAQRLKQLRYEQARLQEQAAKEVATAKNDVDGANHRVKVIQQRLDALNQQLSASKRAVIEHYAPLLTDHLAHARLFAAQQIINAVEQVPPHWRANQERIEHGIAEAQRLLGEAHRAERASRLADAESLVDQALARCADLPQAQSFKASLRPEAPTHLETSIERGNVALTWKPSPSRGVRYIIVRSQGKAPLSERDGFRLATVGTCAWRDESVAPARRLWYAVFAERGSARSARAAISAAVLVVPDVADVQAEASDGAVELRWRLPRHAQSIRVVRNEMHAPGTPDDGQVFTLGESTHFGDTHLSNGRRYHYRIYCEYTGPDGDMLRSEGIAATSIPTPGLAVVPELTLSGKTGITNHTIRIDAPPPTLGTLVIYRTGAPPGLLAGTKVPVDQHKPLLGPDCHTVSGQSDVLFQAGEYFYTPVVLFQQMAYIGEPRVYRYCPPVRQPKATDIPGQGIEVCWTLPPGCDSAEVRCVALAPGAAMPSVALVPRGATSDAVYVARGLLRGEYTLHVLARYQFAGQIVYSSEKTLQVTHAAPVRIRYALQTQRGFMGRVHVELVMCADEPVARPGIQVVYGRETITSPADGHPLAVFADSPLPAMTWTMDLPEFTPESGARVYVFPDPSPQDADVVFEYAPALPLK